MSSTKRHGTVALVAIGAAVVSFLATVILAPSAYAQQFRGGDELKVSDGYITLLKAKKRKLRVQESLPGIQCWHRPICEYCCDDPALGVSCRFDLSVCGQ
jgi:hypothetical protein